MPVVHIHVARGRSGAERKAILDGVHAALVEGFRISDEDRKQILHEHDPENFESGKGLDFTLVEITAFPGRSADVKRELYRAIVARLKNAPGIRPESVHVIINERPLIDWGTNGGIAAADAHAGASKSSVGHDL